MDNVEIKVLHPWLYDKYVHAKCHYQNDKYIIEVPKGASTQTRLRELGHSRCGLPYTMQIYSCSPSFEKRAIRGKKEMDCELEAELFRYAMIGKHVDWRIIRQPLCHMLNKYHMATRLHWLFVLAIDVLKTRRIPIPKKDKARLWWALRNAKEDWALKTLSENKIIRRSNNESISVC